MALEAVSTFFDEYIKSPMRMHLVDPFRWERKFRNLEEEVEELEWYRNRALRSGVQIDEELSLWLSEVDNEIGEAQKLILRKEEAKKFCVGVCPNLKTHYRLSKKADEKASVIRWLSFRCPVEPSVFTRKALPSREVILEQIMNALKEPQMNVIGVYETLAKEVHAKANHERMFEKVILVTVSPTPDLRRIQSEIAEFLDMSFNAEELPGRASELRRRLEDSKVLIILDNLCSKLDLNAVGIPSGDSLKGSKLLLASRNLDVLRNEMGTQKEFFLFTVSHREAWKLFYTLVPEAPYPHFEETATKISRQCAGLPLLIDIAAMELKNKELDEWKYFSKQISMFGDERQEWKCMSMLQSMLRNQHGEEMKSLLLLCLMFAPSNIEIQRLLMYTMGLGLFKHTDDTVRGARDKLFTLIDMLKAESWLLDGDMDGLVKIHDAHWNNDIQLKLARVYHIFVAQNFREFSTLDQKCTKISLHIRDVSEFPSNLECPKADLFLLFTEDQYLKMPHSFFEKMRNLRVVDFNGMCFTSLPLSLGLLTNLHTLSLQKCQLHDVSFIGKLQKLQQLSFAYSRIVRLPKEIQELTQLKLLDLSNCTLLQVIPANVLSKLCHLEELYMLASFKRWGAKGNASLEELTKLKKLSSLEIQIENPKLIPEGLRLFKGLELKQFELFVSVVDEASDS